MMEPSGFREVVRTATVTYPIPFISALCFAFTALTLVLAIIADSPLRWVILAFGGVSMTFAGSLIAWTASRRPGLLRSERDQFAHRVLDLIGDSDLTPQTIDELGRLVSGEPRSKKASRTHGSSRK